MLFNSIPFLVFLPIVFMMYWFVAQRNVRFQNLILLFASYFFYGWWDPRFLILIFVSSAIDFAIGLALSQPRSAWTRKSLFMVSVSFNLGMLGVFKYYNFFIDSFVDLLSKAGITTSVGSLDIVLPVGISFYTFQTLSYSIDVYRRRIEPTHDAVAFFVFVSFFPQLVAGPIERASNLLPQFLHRRVFDYSAAVDGLRQTLWGLFKKIVIADNCGLYADQAFNDHGNFSSIALIAGAFCFSLQIYCDFSGYSDVAIGVSRLFGFSLMRNFAFPYFSRDVAEFWRRWHISLSTWFRDYVYLPLGGSRVTRARMIRNTFIVFLVSGLWHGASWTFVVWGLLNSLYFLPLQLAGMNRRFVAHEMPENNWLPSLREIRQILVTFSLTLVAWVFFRAESLNHALSYLKHTFSFNASTAGLSVPVELWVLITFFLLIEWAQRGRQHPLEMTSPPPSAPLRWTIYGSLLWLILVFGGQQQDFIYFQF
ncbi:MBOAT family O-acyltransferase [Planctomycetaceae bacterium SH139]